jgi:HPt (histidine-containing phosphotransfer) domain-containing protein
VKLPVSPERFDLSDMRRRLGDDETLIVDLLNMFLESCATQLTGVRGAVESRQADAVRKAAHTFKGAAANLSATRIKAAAAALEEAGEQGQTADFDRLFAALAAEVDGLVAELTGEPTRRS